MNPNMMMNQGMMGMGGNMGMNPNMMMNQGMMDMSGNMGMNPMMNNMMNQAMMGGNMGMNPNMMMNQGMMGMGGNMGMNPMMNNMMNQGMMGMGGNMGMNPMMNNMMNQAMMGMGGMQGVGNAMNMEQFGSINIEDQNGWNLIFEDQEKIKIAIRISEQKLVKEAINIYKIKSMKTQQKCKFIYNNKELCGDLKICQSGLQNTSTITVISTGNLKGA